jgi:hypothetical protein
LEFPLVVRDNGIGIVIIGGQADQVATTLLYRLEDPPFDYQVARAALRGPDGELPLLRATLDRMEFAPVPAHWTACTCLIQTLSESDRLLPQTTRSAFDPYDYSLDPALVEKVNGWLLGDPDNELRGTDCNGWWAFELPLPPSRLGATQPIGLRFDIGEYTFTLDSLTRGPSGGRLQVDVEHPSLVTARQLEWMARSSSWKEYVARCHQADCLPVAGLARPGLTLKDMASGSLLRGFLVGPCSPLLNRWYAMFPATAGPAVLMLDGVTGLHLPEFWSVGVKVEFFTEPVCVDVEFDLGFGPARATVSVDIGLRSDDTLLLCPEVVLKDGPFDQVWISGASLQDASGAMYEASGTSTVDVDGNNTWRTGLSFPPVHQEGPVVTLVIQTVDVTLRNPLESPVLPGVT